MESLSLFTYVLNGLTLASCFFLIASGLTLIFGVLRILNFAHAALFMLGAYMSAQMIVWFDNFWVALLIVPPLVALLGAGMERTFLRRVYQLPIAYQLLLTFGFILVIKDTIKLIWGTSWRTVSEPYLLSGSCVIFGTTYPLYNAIYIGFVATLALAIWFFLKKTTYGKIVRAAAADREMASAMGINVRRVYTWVCAVGIGLAGVMGVFHGPMMNIHLDVDNQFLIPAFAVVVIGGLGSVPGAFLGAILVGLSNSFGLLLIPRFQMAFMYILMAVVLIVRPQGLLGSKE